MTRHWSGAPPAHDSSSRGQRSAHRVPLGRQRVRGRRRRKLLAGARRDAGHRGRIGLRQVGDLALHHAAGAQPAGQDRGRRDPIGRPQPARPAGSGDARRAGRCHLDDFPGADDQPQPGPDGGRADRRGDPAAPRGVRRRGARPRARDAEAGAHSLAGDPPRRVSASAFRRHAPADHDRHGARLRSQDPDRRRADHGARRHHPGADSRPAARPARAYRHGHHADHPRSRRRGGARPPGDRDVCRPDRRGGAGRPSVRRPAASLYAGPFGLDPAAGQRRRRAPDRHRGHGAQSLRPAARLRFSPRCPLADARCRSEQPQLREIGRGHRAACWKAPLDLALAGAAAS